MSGPALQTQRKIKAGYQELLRIKDGLGMSLAAMVRKVKAQLSESLATQHPVKLLAGLALGAVLVTLIGVPLGLTGAANSAVSLPAQSQDVAPSMADPYDRSLHDDVPGVELTSNSIGLKAGDMQRCQVILGEEWFHSLTGELTAPLPEWIHFDKRTNTYVRPGC